MDPVTLGLCSQIDLDFEVNRAAKERPKVEEDRSQTLVSAEITTARPAAPAASQLEVFGVADAEAQAGRREDRRQFGVRQAQGEGAARRRIGCKAGRRPAPACKEQPSGIGQNRERL